MCTVHMPANRLAPPTSHPTEALVQSRLQSPSSPHRCRVEGFSGQLGPSVFNSETNLSSSTFHFTPADGWCRLSQGLAKNMLAHPTQPLVQSRHQLFHLRTDVECKVFLASEAFVCLILKLISLIFSLDLNQLMSWADFAIVS